MLLQTAILKNSLLLSEIDKFVFTVNFDYVYAFRR